MRVETTSRTLYKFEELTEQAKHTAMSELQGINIEYDWWDGVYEDAANVGIKITSSDMDRYVNADILDCKETAYLIIDNHGPTCETHKTAAAFIAAYNATVDKYPLDADGERDERGMDSELDDLEDEFKRDICEDYRIMLQHEYDYLTSDAAIIETIEANEYEFTEDGTPA